MKIVGYKRWIGDYNGKPYDSCHVYVEDENSLSLCSKYGGTCPDMYKIRGEVLYKAVNPDKLDLMIGKDITLYFDARKNVSLVEIK